VCATEFGDHDPEQSHEPDPGKQHDQQSPATLGWGWAAFVWGYALLWFFANDRVKLLAYRILDPVKAGDDAKDLPKTTATKTGIENNPPSG
jgi:hypothetical protein